MNSFRRRRHSRLLESLRERRMRMTRPRHILRRSTILDSQDALGNHLPRIRADDMDAQDAIRLSISDELNHAVGLEVRLGARVGGEGEGAGLVLDARGLDFGLVLPDPGHLRVRVHDGRDGAVVDVAVAFGDVFDGRDGFFFGFVREHGAEGAVADDADVREFGAVFLVDHQPAFFVGLQADVFEA